jgi:exodeoxyribonuclease VII large subunit
MEKKGVGVLFDKYQRTLEYYKSKGYYLSERKRPIPKFPKKIGVITASTGAVIQDIITTVSSRYPIAEIVLFPTIVQGKDAKTSISSNIYKANTHDDLDVLIIGRGGGSFEDLFAFNEEEVIEAIYLSRIPTITAIGHETDTSISDFVSDLRAPTPTSAATLATPHKIELFLLIKNLKNNLYKNTVNKLLELRHNLDHLTYILEKSSIKEKIRNKKLVLENLVKYLKINLNNNLLLKRRRTLELVNNLKRNKINLKILEFYNLISKLNSLNEANYKKVILNNQKKFNVLNNRLLELKNVFKDFLVKVNKNIIKSIDDFKVGDTLEVEFITGNVVSIVKEINKNG